MRGLDSQRIGWISNRVRLTLTNLLVRDALVNWGMGEDFFRRHLVDYDKVLNVDSWRWATSVGVDPPSPRTFNPNKQSERYDPPCLYVKRCIPELVEL